MKPYKQHLKGYRDLITPYEKTRAGFASIALERNERATPHVAEAKDLKAKAERAKTPAELRRMPDIHSGLLTASGISDKASGHIDAQGQKDAIDGFIDKYLEPADDNFVEELVYRFLLTRGDTLGGSMRNMVGAIAQRRFTRGLPAGIRIAGTVFYWLPNTSKAFWQTTIAEDPKVMELPKGICWKKDGNARTLLYNINVPFFITVRL